MHVRIIGVGSPAGGDQVGWWVIEALQGGGMLERLACTTSTMALDRPGAQLVHHLADADVVVLIDAIKSGHPPGTIYRLDDVTLPENDQALSTHGFGVASALALARALGGLPASLIVYGIEIENHACGSAPSAAVGQAVAMLAERIAAELSDRCSAIRPTKNSSLKREHERSDDHGFA